MIRFGKTIRSLRTEHGMKQRDLALRLPVTPTYLSHLENDRVEPSVRLLKKIAVELETPVEVLFWDSVELPKQASADDKKACGLARLVVKHWYESAHTAPTRTQQASRRKARPR
ncbi:MAG: helix-turn-helix transcriptional regulator [Candidatus Methylomirabilota bacterium]|jgi:transcriptional regulator with XRE-family HTH domain